MNTCLHIEGKIPNLNFAFANFLYPRCIFRNTYLPRNNIAKNTIQIIKMFIKVVILINTTHTNQTKLH